MALGRFGGYTGHREVKVRPLGERHTACNVPSITGTCGQVVMLNLQIRDATYYLSTCQCMSAFRLRILTNLSDVGRTVDCIWTTCYCQLFTQEMVIALIAHRDRDYESTAKSKCPISIFSVLLTDHVDHAQHCTSWQNWATRCNSAVTRPPVVIPKDKDSYR